MQRSALQCTRIASRVPFSAPQLRATAAARFAWQCPQRQFRAAMPAFAEAKPPTDRKPDPASTPEPKLGLWRTMIADLAAMRAETKDMGMWGTIKHLGKQYGIVAFVVYETIWISTIGGSYMVFAAVRKSGLQHSRARVAVMPR